MKASRLITGFFIVLLFVIILIDLPSQIPIKLNIAALKIDTVFQRPTLNLRIFGKQIVKDFDLQLGLDLKGGSHLVFQADMKEIKPQDRQDALVATRDIIERRVNLFGVAESAIQTWQTGEEFRIVVDLPGVKNVGEAISLIGKTARLEFTETASSAAAVATDTPQFLQVTKKTGLTGQHVKKSQVQFDSAGKPSVGLVFTGQGAKLFEEITTRNVGKPVGIFLDEFPLSIPTVQQVITGGEAVITGDFTLDEAKKLSIAINSGALPVSIKLIEQRNIGPTLGAEQVNKSIFAGFVGLLAVVLFMILFYGKLGIIASIALIIYGLISLAIFKLIPVVLTLSGVAGFILSIGMAVDSNILIFERMKEEMRKGIDTQTATRVGFGRAIDAIKDANLTTLLVSFILFNPLNWSFFPQFGLVRGFALTLAIGVLTSLFTGVVITKRLIENFYKND